MKILSVTILLLLASVSANAATLKIATITPEGSQWMKEMRAGAKEIQTRTDGRVEIKYYGGGVMGNDAKVLGRIRIGALQGGAFTPTALAGIYPNISLYGLPYTFRSNDEVAYVRNKMDAELTAGLEDAGFVSFGFASGGFALIMSNEPVRTIDDLKGRRVWVPEGDKISYASMQALSSSPVTLPLTDVLTGLQTGLIDIVAISPIGALVLQWHTKVKYLTDMPILYTMGFMAIDKTAFYKLKDEDQVVVRDVMTKIYKNFDKENLVENQAALKALLNSGITEVKFNQADYDELRDRVLASNRKLAEQGLFSLALYDKMLALVKEYRQKHGVNEESATGH